MNQKNENQLVKILRVGVVAMAVVDLVLGSMRVGMWFSDRENHPANDSSAKVVEKSSEENSWSSSEDNSWSSSEENTWSSSEENSWSSSEDNSWSSSEEDTWSSSEESSWSSSEDVVEPYVEPDYIWEGLFTEKLTKEKYYEIKSNNQQVFPGRRSLAQMMINDLYAYNGYIFKSGGEVRAYYDNKYWYNPDTNDNATIINRLKSKPYQYDNYNLIREIEETRGFYGVFCGPFATKEQAENAIIGHLSTIVVEASKYEDLSGNGYYACIGGYDSQEDAEAYLSEVRSPKGYSYYVGYSGEVCGR